MNDRRKEQKAVAAVLFLGDHLRKRRAEARSTQCDFDAISLDCTRGGDSVGVSSSEHCVSMK